MGKLQVTFISSNLIRNICVLWQTTNIDHCSHTSFNNKKVQRNGVPFKYVTFLFVENVVFQCYHFSKQLLSNLSKIKYLAFFITFCFVLSLEKMVTLKINIVYKNSAQYRKYIWSSPLNYPA